MAQNMGNVQTIGKERFA